MNHDQRLTTAVSFVLMLATMSLGWFSFNQDLSWPKPSSDQPAGVNPTTAQNVASRLWEDPLLAMQMRMSLNTDDKPADVAASRLSQLRETIDVKMKDRKIVLMVVTIPGTPFPDSAETRLRTRYSVQMALARKGCVPKNREHLGYFGLPWPGVDQMHEIMNMSSGTDSIDSIMWLLAGNYNNKPVAPLVFLPYEWFSGPDNNPEKPILVVWLPEELLNDVNLCALAYLQQAISPPGANRMIGPHLIGPRSSDTLRSMISLHDTKKIPACAAHLRDGLKIFSPQATAPDPMMGFPSSTLWRNARSPLNGVLRSHLGGKSDARYFYNYIAPDDQLTDLLIRELVNRNINLKPDDIYINFKSHTLQSDRILILAEADTAYGRSLPMAIHASIESYYTEIDDRIGNTSTSSIIKQFVSKTKTPKNNVIVARYLRGLDAHKGYQGAESKADKVRGKPPEQQLADALSGTSAPAYGDTQLDYAERLAENVLKAHGRGNFKAVGILGSETHDKLILLRSFRPRFSEALFFTTDLDAMLWHPENYKFTRNLVVASTYSVDANNERGNSFDAMPPFRDVYQVGIFHACTAAIMHAVATKPEMDGEYVHETAGAATIVGAPAKETPAHYPMPGIYEIARHGPVRLNIGMDNSKRPQADHPVSGIRSASQAVGVALLPGGLLLWALLRFRNRESPDHSGVHLGLLFQRSTAWIGWHFLGTLALLAIFPTSWGDTPGASIMVACGVWLALCLVELHVHSDPGRNTALEIHNLFDARTAWAGAFALGSSLLMIAFTFIFQSVADMPYAEPWAWSDGVSIWPTELIRLLIIIAVCWMVAWSWIRHLRHRSILARDYKLRRHGHIAGSQPCPSRTTIEKVFEPWPQPRRRSNGHHTLEIDAVDVYCGYINKGVFRARFIRALAGAAIYYCLAYGVMLWVGMPFNTHIRGDVAYYADIFILNIAILCWLFLVFYVLDAVHLASKMLGSIAVPFTIWPPKLLAMHNQELHVKERDLEGYIDVLFAADKTRETGRLVILPFIIQFLMLFARSSHFDNWKWPPALLLIFTINILLCLAVWFILRRAAARIRQAALANLRVNLLEAERDATASLPEGAATPSRVPGLYEIKRRIEDIHVGAFSRWFQDPALIAVLLPTGLLGLLSILFQALFGVI